jgi:VWFA-related protein
MTPLLVALMGSVTVAQSPAGQDGLDRAAQFTLSQTVRLVVLDVVVTDKQGNLVPDLTSKDFAIYEDKQKQTIHSFEGSTDHHLPPEVRVESTADLAKAPDTPVTILVLDELNTRFEDMAYARFTLKSYLLRQSAVLPHPVALLVAGNTKFKVLMDYTRDRAALLNALDQHFPEYPWKMQLSGKSGPGTAERLAMSLGSLQQIAQATSGHPGRKNVIWVGRGFPSVNTIQSPDRDALVIQGALRTAINALRDARITLSTIDPTANASSTVDIETPDDLATAEDENGGDPFPGNVNFQLIAPATGGRVFYSRNDIDNEIGTSIRDGENYYTLSYSPSNRNDQAQPYRRISIQINRPGLIATTRNGYYIRTDAPPRSTTPAEVKGLRAKLAFDMGSAANSDIAYTGLACSVSPMAGKPNAFVLHVDSPALAWRELPGESRQAEVTILVASFSKEKKMIGHLIEEIATTLPVPQPGVTQQATADFTVTNDIPTDAVRVRFVVRDAANGKIGTVDYAPQMSR